MIVALCLIANYNLEHEYIEEYCRYYFDKIGIDRIYILDDITNNLHKLCEIEYISKLIINNKITYIEIPHTKLILLYNQFYKEHNKEFDWCCFFDCDEFIQLNKHSNIHDWLSCGAFDNDCNVILVTWKIYGDNDYICTPKQNFKDKYIDENNIIDKTFSLHKVIARGDVDNLVFSTAHTAYSDLDENNNMLKLKHSCGMYFSNHKYDRFIAIKSDMDITYEYAQLNHVLYRSFEEFIRRKKYGVIWEEPDGRWSKENLRLKFKYMEYSNCKWSELRLIIIDKAFK